ncbi:MAG: hypothetical protein H7Y59_07880 [Anaerolineales bacterium]|nr:hypothetical protein [Anaerolineales bacterium]
MLPELSLKYSELRYRRLFETTQDGILILHAWTGYRESTHAIEGTFMAQSFIKGSIIYIGSND